MDDMRTKLEELEKVKAERDTFKLQVEDLEAIRRAYSQLVGHCTLSESDALDLEKNIEGKVFHSNQNTILRLECSTLYIWHLVFNLYI